VVVNLKTTNENIMGKKLYEKLEKAIEQLENIFNNKDMDDFAMTINNLFFRLEKMDENRWWFQIYRDGEPVFIDNNIADTRSKAINTLIERGNEIFSTQKQSNNEDKNRV